MFNFVSVLLVVLVTGVMFANANHWKQEATEWSTTANKCTEVLIRVSEQRDEALKLSQDSQEIAREAQLLLRKHLGGQ
jgi:hypothetical protein